MSTFLALYVLFGPLAWAGVCALAASGRMRMGKLHRIREPLPTPAPTLSIVVPAKDEAAGLRDCVSRVLAQDYPDAARRRRRRPQHRRHRRDPRRDRGGRAARPRGPRHAPARRLARQVPRVVRRPPRGLTSEWLLFVDSDVQLAPDAARRAVAGCAARDYHALSILPHLDCRAFWERALLPALAMAWGATFRVSLTNVDSRPEFAFANGQFFLIRRDHYERAGGHAAVRDQIVEDVALMRVLKRGGTRTRFMLGGELARARMHTSLRQMFHGWARIFAGSSGRSVRPIVGAIAFLAGTLALLAAGVAAAIATGRPAWVAAAGAHVAIVLGYCAWTYAAAGQRAAYALLLPVTWPMVIAMLAFAARVCRTGTVVWRGHTVGVGRGVGATAEPNA